MAAPLVYSRAVAKVDLMESPMVTWKVVLWAVLKVDLWVVSRAVCSV